MGKTDNDNKCRLNDDSLRTRAKGFAYHHGSYEHSVYELNFTDDYSAVDEEMA